MIKPKQHLSLNTRVSSQSHLVNQDNWTNRAPYLEDIFILLEYSNRLLRLNYSIGSIGPNYQKKSETELHYGSSIYFSYEWHIEPRGIKNSKTHHENAIHLNTRDHNKTYQTRIKTKKLINRIISSYLPHASLNLRFASFVPKTPSLCLASSFSCRISLL